MAGSNASETLTSAATLQGLLAHEAELIQQASEALPHSFEKCTYSMGPIRQMVYWCRTCAEPRGICSACSIACHGGMSTRASPHRSFIIPEVTSLTTARHCTDHEQVELFAKRDFQCDCPTSCLSHQCTLHKILAAPNDANTYGQNYIGNFCRCGRPYDAATEEETMVQCVACEASYSTPAELVWPSSHLRSPERPGLVPRVMPSPACTGHQWFAHRNPRCTGRRYW
jgi:E3 ubiquitin-protein ligase UBR7